MMSTMLRYLLLCLFLLSFRVCADVTLTGHMDIGDNSSDFLKPTTLISASGSKYSPVKPIHFSLSQQTTITQFSLGSASNAIYPVNFIVWDSNNNTVIGLTQANNGLYTLTGSWTLPAGDYQMAVFGQCAVWIKNNTTVNKNYDANCGDSVLYNSQYYRSDWDDFSFTNIVLSGAESNTIHFIERGHIGDSTDATRWYPSAPSGLSISKTINFTKQSKLDVIALYGLTDVQYSNVSSVALYQNNTLLWSSYINVNGTFTTQPSITLAAGLDYQLKIITKYVTSSDAEDIDWDDIVLKYTPLVSDGSCSSVFPYPVQGRSDSDSIDFNSSQNYISPQVLGTINGIIGYKNESQLIDRGYTYQYGWYGDKISGNCDGKYCLPSGQSTNSLSNISNPFPLTVSSQEYSVGWSENKTLSTGSTINYKQITLNSSASLNISASGLKTASLSIGWNSAVTFAAGEYWIETLTMDDSAKIILAGKVILHVKTMTIASHSLINSAAINASGTPENLLIILHGALTLGSQATLSGFIYQTDDAANNQQISMVSPSYIFGRISAKRIVMTDGSVINGTANTCPTYSTSSTNHYELQYSSSNITCEPASVTVRACSDAATPCTLNSTATDSVSLTSSPTSSFSSNPVTLSGGTVTTTISHYVAENVKLGLSTGTPVCLKDGVVDASCALPFVDSVFSFNFPTFFAGGNSGAVTLKALKSTATSSGAQCSALFTGSKSINFTKTNVLPSSPTTIVSPTVNGTAISTSTPVSLSFNSSGEASVQLGYAEAGVLGITASYTATDTSKGGTLSVTGSDQVAVLPSLIRVTALNQTACTGSSDALYAACAKYKAVGENFTVNATAGYWNGSTWVTTSNFAPETGVSTSLTHELVAPSGGTLPAFAANTLNYVSGVATTSIAEKDVGVYRYGVPSFVPYPTYQDEASKLTVPLVWSDAVGRIYPRTLSTTVSTNGTLTTAQCNAQSAVNSLGYTGQAFYFAAAPVMTVTALQSDGSVSANYQGAFAKIRNENAANSGNFIASMIPKNNANSLTSTAVWSNGVWATPTNAASHQYTWSTSSTFTFARTASAVAPFEPQFSITTLQDSDGATAQNLPLAINPTTPATSAFQIYTGRLHLDNANAAETDVLSLPFYLQYWNGTAWAQNTADNCTTLTGNELLMNSAATWSNIALLTSEGVSSNAKTTATLSPATVVSGAGAIQFSAPNSVGWVDLTGSSSLPVWLRDSSETNGVNAARANFGFFRGNDRIIYRREVYNDQ